jgi:hypothetical protein
MADALFGYKRTQITDVIAILTMLVALSKLGPRALLCALLLEKMRSATPPIEQLFCDIHKQLLVFLRQQIQCLRQRVCELHP